MEKLLCLFITVLGNGIQPGGRAGAEAKYPADFVSYLALQMALSLFPGESILQGLRTVPAVRRRSGRGLWRWR